MSKKKLNTAGVRSELTGKSAFFEPAEKSTKDKPINKEPTNSITETKPDTMPPRHHDTVIPRHHDTAMIESVRKALKSFGKEAATHRFTLEEKQGIGALVFAFRQKNIRTSENEIARIAINWLILDHKNHKENSILQQTLLALNS